MILLTLLIILGYLIGGLATVCFIGYSKGRKASGSTFNDLEINGGNLTILAFWPFVLLLSISIFAHFYLDDLADYFYEKGYKRRKR